MKLSDRLQEVVELARCRCHEGIGFFLGDTDKDHRVAHRSLSAQLMSAPVFGFVALKVKQRDILLFGESLDFGDEPSSNLAQQRR
jgi:hypothetical protein